MKKLISSILVVASIFTITIVASEKINNKTINLPEEFKSSKILITENQCKKYLGEENYKFIAEVYNDKTAPLLKCKEEMNK